MWDLRQITPHVARTDTLPLMDTPTGTQAMGTGRQHTPAVAAVAAILSSTALTINLEKRYLLLRTADTTDLHTAAASGTAVIIGMLATQAITKPMGVEEVEGQEEGT